MVESYGLKSIAVESQDRANTRGQRLCTADKVMFRAEGSEWPLANDYIDRLMLDSGKTYIPTDGAGSLSCLWLAISSISPGRFNR